MLSPGHVLGTVCTAHYVANRQKAFLNGVRIPREFLTLCREGVESVRRRGEADRQAE